MEVWGDQLLIDMLNNIRLGNLSEKSFNLFMELRKPIKCPEGYVATELFATRNEVEFAYKKKLQELEGDEVVFDANDNTTLSPSAAEQLSSSFMAVPRLVLKKGCQVLCIKNFDDQIVNGTVGKVIGFKSKLEYLQEIGLDAPVAGNRKYPFVEFVTPLGLCQRLIEPEEWQIDDEKGNPKMTRVQLPLLVLYSLTIHKSQGQSLQYVVVDFKNIFEFGHAYVALSRAISRDGLQILNFNPRKIMANSKVIKFYKNLSE